jgi:hypothetical protein
MLESGSFDAPDEVLPFADKGRAEFVTVGGHRILRGHYEPGWRWSEHLKPIVKTDSCQITHTGYVISGRMAVRMEYGREAQVGPGTLSPSGLGTTRG